MNITIYGKEGCEHCTNAVNLARENNLAHTYYDINEVDLEILLTKTAPGAKTVPIVIVNNVWIGGHDQFESHIKDWQGMVAKLRELLRSGKTAVVKFLKKDGTGRRMVCTQNFDNIPEDKHPKGDESSVRNDLLFKVFDLENNGWRSFRAESLLSVE